MPFFEDYGKEFTMDYYGDIPCANAGMHIHPQYEMLVVLDHTSSQITINGQTYHPNQPFIAFFAPFALHHADFFDKVKVARYIYYFDDAMIDKHSDEFKSFEDYRDSVSMIFLLPPDMAERLRALNVAALNNRDDDAVRRLLFMMNIHFLFKDKDRCTLMQTNNQVRHINSIVHYMIEHFQDKNLTAESVAQYFFISRSKLYRDFRNYTMISFHQFLIELRISKAQFMLQKGYSIREIASSVGFENESYFCQFFKKIKGISPLQYGKQRQYKKPKRQSKS